MLNPKALRNYITGSGVRFRENSVSYIFPCPRCGKKDKLYIRKTDGKFVCWKCKELDGFKGNAEYALAEILGERLDDVKAALGLGGTVSAVLHLEVDLKDWFGEGDEIPADATAELEAVQWPWNVYTLDHPHSARGVKYLAGRGVPADIAMQYGVRYCPELREVVFPVEANGKLFGWQGRIVYPNKWVDDNGEEHEVIKSPSSKGLKRERLLMFADRLRDVDHALVAEGPVDGMKAHLCGGNVVTMGKGISRYQLQLLRNSGKRRIYLALDPDAAQDVARVVRDLACDEVELYVLPDLPAAPTDSDDKKMDLGRLSMEEVYDLFRRSHRVNASRLFVFLKPFA